MNFSNEKSLKDTYGDDEVSALLLNAPGTESDARLEKAAATATAEIEDFLKMGGYTVPIPFTEYGVTPLAIDASTGLAMPYLRANIQAIADCFTVWWLANSADLAKKKYDDCRASGLAWLAKVAAGELLLTASGKIVVIARPQVFDTSLMRERDVFGYYYR